MSDQANAESDGLPLIDSVIFDELIGLPVAGKTLRMAAMQVRMALEQRGMLAPSSITADSPTPADGRVSAGDVVAWLTRGIANLREDEWGDWQAVSSKRAADWMADVSTRTGRRETIEVVRKSDFEAERARADALARAAYSPSPAVEALLARAEAAESRLAKAVERMEPALEAGNVVPPMELNDDESAIWRRGYAAAAYWCVGAVAEIEGKK